MQTSSSEPVTRHPSPVTPYALLFANGDCGDGVMARRALDMGLRQPGTLLIAADGGARTAAYFGLVPQHIIGDMDSLDDDEIAHFAEQGAQVHRSPAEKDETDLELALLFALRHGSRWMRVFGAIGDRLDQTLSNVYLLGLPALAGCDVRLVSGKQEMWLIGAGAHAIAGAVGDTVSLLPMAGAAAGITTDGLYYPLRGETLHPGPARGVSNVLSQEQATVRLESGVLLVVHTVGRA